jgi:hypothetical protein
MQLMDQSASHLLLKAKDGRGQESPHRIHGGYANATGAISLFCDNVVYRINFKNRTAQQRPSLNPGAQARYNAVEPGQTFEYGGVTFRRLSEADIEEVCASGSFRVSARFI